MSKLLRSWIVLMVAVGLLVGAGVAWADDEMPEEQPTGDTVLSFGYDALNHVFIVNSSATGDCTMEASDWMVGYGAVEDGSLDLTPPENTDAECEFTGALVGGPNGQINHGQFMTLFHQLLGQQGGGCANRVFAQSDLGKGDQQIRTGDVDSTFELGLTGEVQFTSVPLDCKLGKLDKGKDKGKNKAERGESPGKSGEARGRNK